jgi:PAS domain S-box-containing protein
MTDATGLSANRPLAGHVVRPDDLAAFVDAADAALCVTDETGCCVALNEAAAMLLGLDRGDLLGRPAAPLIDDASAWLRTVVRQTATVDGRSLAVTTLRPVVENRGPDVDALADLRARLTPSVRALGNFAEIFRSRTFGPLGHDRYGDFALAMGEAVRAVERAMEDVAAQASVQALPPLLDERVCSLRGLLTAALRRHRQDMAVDVAGDDVLVRCDPSLLVEAIDAMIGPDPAARPAAVAATIARLVDGRTVIGIHHRDDGYPLGWARSAACLPLDGRDAIIDVSAARRIFEAHGGSLLVNTEGDAGISVLGVIGAGRLIEATARPPSAGVEIRRAVYVDATMAPTVFAALPPGGYRLDAAGRVLAHVTDGDTPSAPVPTGRRPAEGPLGPIWSEGLKRMVRRAAERGVRGLYETTVEVGDRLRILHVEVVPAQRRPGQCWLFLGVI